mmetsp:Transcript_23281/g.55413  ORF Transcript_23281/g.55413 Transcript_23281/m.55413 type:complete len:203 (-) Transcript_23281:13-621(-)
MSSSWRKSVAEKTRDTFAAPILLLACSETISRRNVNTWRRMSNLAWDSAANLSLKMSTRAFRDPFENCASSSAFQVCEGRSGGSMWIRVCFSVPATVWICSSSRSTLTVAPSPIEASSASFGVSVFIRTSEPLTRKIPSSFRRSFFFSQSVHLRMILRASSSRSVSMSYASSLPPPFHPCRLSMSLVSQWLRNSESTKLSSL